MASAVPTPDNDVIDATMDGEIIDGLTGNDLLRSAFGAATLIGNAGDDLLLHHARVAAGDVRSDLRGDNGNDALISDISLDLFSAPGSHQTSMDGGEGNDYLQASLRVETPPDSELFRALGHYMQGGAGDDVLRLTASLPDADENFVVFGDDRQETAGGNDLILTDIAGRGLQQDLSGGPGDDVILTRISSNGFIGNAYGGEGDDLVLAALTFPDDQAFAGLRLEGGDGSDVLIATASGPEGSRAFVGVFGGAGSDALTAVLGDGILGAARLAGENGDDVMAVAGGGLDPTTPNLIEGGAGSDWMAGSADADLFGFRVVDDDGIPGQELANGDREGDTIVNFNPDEDRIDLPGGAADVVQHRELGPFGLLLTLAGDGDRLLLVGVDDYDAAFIV
jgi:hypothetical protein